MYERGHNNAFHYLERLLPPKQHLDVSLTRLLADFSLCKFPTSRVAAESGVSTSSDGTSTEQRNIALLVHALNLH
ncbi:hypothetical protein Bpfe_030097 [Biomphalaria pfeifferi]|uniref:Uncharacterized protein n=1 Tax=Biomphalaria pfeifferi TaxID=112525 RepID=A0AAD8ARW3_BIOPF|nr:hypothetical protein Bpfe_030097 [Biomphalaria pfeifferi]